MNENQDNSKKTGSKLLILLIVILTALVSSMGMYIWNMKKQKDLESKISMMKSQMNPRMEKSISTKKESKSNIVQKSTLEDIDDTWQHYTNNEFGYSIDIPQESYNGYGLPCTWVDGEYPSYRPEGGMVPVTVFEGDDGVYIANEYQYEMSGETQHNNIHYYSECARVNNTYDVLESGNVLSWKIVVEDISSEQELEDYIKNRYGAGCSLGDQVVTAQEGVFDVEIEGDGLDLGETACPLNYITVLKYYPEQNKVASWHIGQALTFMDDTLMDGYDMLMLDSFRFE